MHKKANSMSVNAGRPPKPTKITSYIGDREENLIKSKIKEDK